MARGPEALAEPPRFPLDRTGRAHTEESRAKISAANKGNVPWNRGRKHSEETRRKIAEATRNAMLARKERQAAERERMRLEEPEQYAEAHARPLAGPPRRPAGHRASPPTRDQQRTRSSHSLLPPLADARK